MNEPVRYREHWPIVHRWYDYAIFSDNRKLFCGEQMDDDEQGLKHCSIIKAEDIGRLVEMAFNREPRTMPVTWRDGGKIRRNIYVICVVNSTHLQQKVT